ncbi:MAG: protein translocase subunit SecF [Proteobacteria bacterium]|nr:protein translocase subunit SecF [Pseudomonadota bacterium]
MALQLIPNNTNVNFIGFRFVTFFIAGFFILLGSIGYFKGLNFGIDFKGGHSIEVHLKDEPNLDDIRDKLHALHIGEVAVQQLATSKDLLIKVELQEGDDSKQTTAIDSVKKVIGENQDYRKISTVGPKIGTELANNALKAVLLALAAMLIYIAVRFEWQFAVCAIVALFHDCLAIVSLFCWTPLEFSENSVIAILITAGYSINDTIVIFDRIRENIKRFKRMELAELINKSLNETLSRTIMTASTTLLALLALYFTGGPVISSFSLPIIIGITIGSFSSICLASPLLLYMHLPRHDKDQKEPIVINV